MKKLLEPVTSVAKELHYVYSYSNKLFRSSFLMSDDDVHPLFYDLRNAKGYSDEYIANFSKISSELTLAKAHLNENGKAYEKRALREYRKRTKTMGNVRIYITAFKEYIAFNTDVSLLRRDLDSLELLTRDLGESIDQFFLTAMLFADEADLKRSSLYVASQYNMTYNINSKLYSLLENNSLEAKELFIEFAYTIVKILSETSSDKELELLQSLIIKLETIVVLSDSKVAAL